MGSWSASMESGHRGRATPPGAARHGPVYKLVFDERPKVAPAQRVTQLPERFSLDLPDSLARNGEALADFLEGVLAFLADAEAQTQDLLLLGREHGQRALDLSREVLV